MILLNMTTNTQRCFDTFETKNICNYHSLYLENDTS